MRAAKVQVSLRIRAVSPEPSLLAPTSSESRGTFRQKARSLAPLNGWACAVKICRDGMLEDTNSLDVAQLWQTFNCCIFNMAAVINTYSRMFTVKYGFFTAITLNIIKKNFSPPFTEVMLSTTFKRSTAIKS